MPFTASIWRDASECVYCAVAWSELWVGIDEYGGGYLFMKAGAVADSSSD